MIVVVARRRGGEEEGRENEPGSATTTASLAVEGFSPDEVMAMVWMVWSNAFSWPAKKVEISSAIGSWGMEAGRRDWRVVGGSSTNEENGTGALADIGSPTIKSPSAALVYSMSSLGVFTEVSASEHATSPSPPCAASLSGRRSAPETAVATPASGGRPAELRPDPAHSADVVTRVVGAEEAATLNARSSSSDHHRVRLREELQERRGGGASPQVDAWVARAVGRGSLYTSSRPWSSFALTSMYGAFLAADMYVMERGAESGRRRAGTLRAAVSAARGWPRGRRLLSRFVPPTEVEPTMRTEGEDDAYDSSTGGHSRRTAGVEGGRDEEHVGAGRTRPARGVAASTCCRRRFGSREPEGNNEEQRFMAKVVDMRLPSRSPWEGSGG